MGDVFPWFPRSLLENSPSEKLGFGKDKEDRIRLKTTQMIDKLADQLKL